MFFKVLTKLYNLFRIVGIVTVPVQTNLNVSKLYDWRESKLEKSTFGLFMNHENMVYRYFTQLAL